MKKIAFVIPWSGKLPDYFGLWLQSCAGNPSVDFLVFTSEALPEPVPDNVKHYALDFAQLQRKFQENFDFPIALNTPYKFCDFKPAYGEVFAEYLTGYDFWGHCDVDLIWGNIRKFITDDIMEQYDRIYTHGHCILYRNTPKVNAMYRTLPHEGMQDWKEVFTHEGSFCFDEWHQGGLSEIVKRNHVPYYDGADMADLNVAKGSLFPYRMQEYQAGTTYFEWSDGTLWMKNAEGKQREVLYAHFQKRPLTIESVTPKHFFLFAPGIVSEDAGRIGKRDRWAEWSFEAGYWKKRVIRKWNKMCRGADK